MADVGPSANPLDELTPGQRAFLRLLREKCTECASERLDWVLAEDALEELSDPEQLALVTNAVAWADGEQVFVWLCLDCGEVGAASGGVF